MTDIHDQELTIAPGGPRPASTVSHVGPGERVNAGAESVEATSAGTPTEVVVTPGGPRPRSSVHLVAAGHHLDSADHELRLLGDGDVVLGRFALPRRLTSTATPALGSGWIAYTGWMNGTGTPISRFTTTWTVPRAPRTSSGQVIFLFNGIEPSDYGHILQPVLQWGVSAAGGGAYWSVASWYVGGDNAFHTDLVRVNEGDVLVGLMTLDSHNANGFTYTSSFAGISGTSLNVTNNPELTWASETLEAYSVTQASDYPATDTTPMTQINIRTGSTTPALTWSVDDAVTDTGQKAVVAVDGALNGEVDLSYRGEAAWSANDLTGAAAAPAAIGDPFGYTWSVDSTEHVVYRGADRHIHELWFHDSWNHNDLTGAAGAPLALGDPIGYTWSHDSTQHVVYHGIDGHLHELWFNRGWHHNDLTAAASAPLPSGKVTGYTWSHDSTEHVVYRGIDGHVHELWFDGGWHHNDLTHATGAPQAASGTPTGYTWSHDTTEHVVYRGIDGHLHELWFDGGWHHNDLTAAAGAPLVAGDPSGYTWDVDTTQHNVFRGLDGHVHELWFDGSWHHNDLTDAAGGPPLAGSDPVGYTWDVDSTQHIVYRGGDGRIHELWFNGAWNYNDLTSAAGNPGLAIGKPAGYTWSADRTEHVVYRRGDNHVIELYL